LISIILKALTSRLAGNGARSPSGPEPDSVMLIIHISRASPASQFDLALGCFF
jgi:hypothetical protein